MDIGVSRILHQLCTVLNKLGNYIILWKKDLMFFP